MMNIISRVAVRRRIKDSCHGLLWRVHLGSMVTLKLEEPQEAAIISAGEMRKAVEWECFYKWWMVMTLLPVIKPILRLIHETL